MPERRLTDAMSLRITFLGTSGAVPTPSRNPIGLAVQREGDQFLFDVGEGVQRQMMRFSTGFRMEHVLLTHTHGDHVLGLPGLVETLDFTERSAPLTVVTPVQKTDLTKTIATISVGEPDFPLRVVGVEPGETVYRADEYQIRAIPADHDAPAIGYVLEEDDRPGRFEKETALELGVPEGPMFGQLQAGTPVELDDGTVVEPAEVLGPPRPGRSIVYSGDTRPTDALIDAADGAQLLIHEATFGDDRADRAVKTGHSTARDAGRVAEMAGVDRLALVHTSSRYAGHRDRLVREAAEEFDGPVVLPDDGDTIDVPYPS